MTRTTQRLIKFNAWYALACGVFCLIVAPLIVDSALRSMGIQPERIVQSEGYLIAVSFVRMLGILLLVYALLIRLLIRQGYDLEDLKSFFTLFAVGTLLWGGMFVLILSTHSGILASACGIGLIEWLLLPAILLFTYKSGGNWESVKPQK